MSLSKTHSSLLRPKWLIIVLGASVLSSAIAFAVGVVVEQVEDLYWHH
jgi:hypothetical protein